jgi:chromate reductase, NAD(P)H dehydrogenase (quinone)
VLGDTALVTLYGGLADLPAFDPDLDTAAPPPAVRHLRTSIHWADAVVFSTPEYAGALPGSFKNLLDWTIGDDAAGSVYEKPVAWLNTAPRGAAGAHAELRTVLTYAHARIVEEACRTVPLQASLLGPDGLVGDPAALAEITALASVLRARVVPRSAS